MSQLELFAPPAMLKRAEALELLRPLFGQDLRLIADALGVTQPHLPIRNSGWAGHTVEWMLGQPPNSHQAPDFGSWELKVTTTALPSARSSPVEESHRSLKARGSIVLTQFQPSELLDVTFEESHLYAKTRHMLIVCHTPLDETGYGAHLLGACIYDLSGERLNEVRREYQDLAWSVATYGVTGLKEVNTRSLGAHIDGPERSQWRFVARSRWVSDMLARAYVR